jgi:hypothetical protein
VSRGADRARTGARARRCRSRPGRRRAAHARHGSPGIARALGAQGCRPRHLGAARDVVPRRTGLRELGVARRRVGGSVRERARARARGVRERVPRARGPPGRGLRGTPRDERHAARRRERAAHALRRSLALVGPRLQLDLPADRLRGLRARRLAVRRSALRPPARSAARPRARGRASAHDESAHPRDHEPLERPDGLQPLPRADPGRAPQRGPCARRPAPRAPARLAARARGRESVLRLALLRARAGGVRSRRAGARARLSRALPAREAQPRPEPRVPEDPAALDPGAQAPPAGAQPGSDRAARAEHARVEVEPVPPRLGSSQRSRGDGDRLHVRVLDAARGRGPAEAAARQLPRAALSRARERASRAGRGRVRALRRRGRAGCRRDPPPHRDAPGCGRGSPSRRPRRPARRPGDRCRRP